MVGPHRLRLGFSDGLVGDVDFSERKWSGVLAPLGDPEIFAGVFVDAGAGTVAWSNGLDLAPEPLHDEARQIPVDSSAVPR